MCEPKLTRFAQMRPFGASFKCDSNMNHRHLKIGGFEEKISHYNDISVKNYPSDYTTQSTNSRNNCVRTKCLKPIKPNIINFNEMKFNCSGMQTLDRRISSSSDQIDTLRKLKMRGKPLRTHSSSRLPFEHKLQLEEDKEDVKFIRSKIYRKCDLLSSSFHRSIPRPGRDVTKTPFALFLEDDGPYSRKLYGPLTDRERNEERQGQGRERRQERIVYRSDSGLRENMKVSYF